jgi:hypothetical protein
LSSWSMMAFMSSSLIKDFSSSFFLGFFFSSSSSSSSSFLSLSSTKAFVSPIVTCFSYPCHLQKLSLDQSLHVFLILVIYKSFR